MAYLGFLAMETKFKNFLVCLQKLFLEAGILTETILVAFHSSFLLVYFFVPKILFLFAMAAVASLGVISLLRAEAIKRRENEEVAEVQVTNEDGQQRFIGFWAF